MPWKRNKIIVAALGNIVRGEHHTFWLRDKHLFSLSQIAAENTLTLRARVPDSVTVFKMNDRKATFRIIEHEVSGRPFVVKSFYFNGLRQKLKYFNFGLDEAVNLLMAAEKGLPVPRVEGYGHIYNRLGLVTAAVIIQEYLEGFVTVSKLLELNREDGSSLRKILMRTIPLFADLFRSGCNHIDVNGGAIMISGTEHVGEKIFILDFQHAKFYESPSKEVLMAEAGRFINSLGDLVPEEMILDWLHALHLAVGIISEQERESLARRFCYYRDTELSRKERKKIR